MKSFFKKNVILLLTVLSASCSWHVHEHEEPVSYYIQYPDGTIRDHEQNPDGTIDLTNDQSVKLAEADVNELKDAWFKYVSFANNSSVQGKVSNALYTPSDEKNLAVYANNDQNNIGVIGVVEIPSTTPNDITKEENSNVVEMMSFYDKIDLNNEEWFFKTTEKYTVQYTSTDKQSRAEKFAKKLANDLEQDAHVFQVQHKGEPYFIVLSGNYDSYTLATEIAQPKNGWVRKFTTIRANRCNTIADLAYNGVNVDSDYCG